MLLLTNSPISPVATVKASFGEPVWEDTFIKEIILMKDESTVLFEWNYSTNPNEQAVFIVDTEIHSIFVDFDVNTTHLARDELLTDVRLNATLNDNGLVYFGLAGLIFGNVSGDIDHCWYTFNATTSGGELPYQFTTEGYKTLEIRLEVYTTDLL